MTAPAFGVYIHWPFCARICPYCDFTVYRDRGGKAQILDALLADIAGHAARYGRRDVDTIFFGGGTPSLLSGAEIAHLIGAVSEQFGLAAGAEITIEANPEDRALFAEHAAAGVNRFSIGVQALSDEALKSLGRLHGRAEALAAVDVAARTGQRVSIDLIYGRHGQNVPQWREELREALLLPAEHLSLYELTIKPETAFERAHARGALSVPGEAEAVSFYEVTQEMCEAGGAPAYEISNYARSTTARARHNLIYWTGGDWIGIGPGASGRLHMDGRRIATRAHPGLSDYAAAVAARGVGWECEVALSSTDVAEERLIMGLRLCEGVERAPIEALRGAPFDSRILETLKEEGLIDEALGRLKLTRAGRLVADRINLLLA